jgi:hypothetical protein
MTATKKLEINVLIDGTPKKTTLTQGADYQGYRIIPLVKVEGNIIPEGPYTGTIRDVRHIIDGVLKTYNGRRTGLVIRTC